jgi:hypothetical protein
MSHKYSTGQNVYYECHSNIRLVGKHAKFRDAVHGPDFYEKDRSVENARLVCTA